MQHLHWAQLTVPGRLSTALPNIAAFKLLHCCHLHRRAVLQHPLKVLLLQVGLKYNLPLLSPVDDAGVFTEEAGQFQGLQVGCSAACMLPPLCQMRSLLTHLQNGVLVTMTCTEPQQLCGLLQALPDGLASAVEARVDNRCMWRQDMPTPWLLGTCSSPLPPLTGCTFPHFCIACKHACIMPPMNPRF